MQQLLTRLLAELAQQRDCVLVTLMEVRGSAPREAGAQMLVGREGLLSGTIGGGAVEGGSIALSLRLLEQRDSCVRDFPLHPQAEGDIGMVCGGDVQVHFQFIPARDELWQDTLRQTLALLEAHRPGWLLLALDGSAPALLSREEQLCGPSDAPALREARLSRAEGWLSLPLPTGQRALLFGAGHISRCLCPLLATVGFRPVVFDDRPELAQPGRFPAAEQVICGDYGRIADYLTVTEEDFVVVLTSGHANDLQVQQQLLPGPFAYMGVIGSRKKTEAVNRRLRELGIPQQRIELVHSPIGTPILAATPEEIAVSIAGEMILTRARRRGDAPHGCPMHE